MNEFSGNLAVFCSDERFVPATIDFLEKILKMERSDLFVLPGGPVFVIQSEPPLMSRLELLLKAHGIKKVALIAHEDCGYYRNRYPELSPDEIRKRQISDLLMAAKILLDKGVNVSIFFAFFEGGKIFFREIRTE